MRAQFSCSPMLGGGSASIWLSARETDRWTPSANCISISPLCAVVIDPICKVRTRPSIFWKDALKWTKQLPSLRGSWVEGTWGLASGRTSVSAGPSAAEKCSSMIVVRICYCNDVQQNESLHGARGCMSLFVADRLRMPLAAAEGALFERNNIVLSLQSH